MAASACILSGLVILALAFISSAVSFVAPYWYKVSRRVGGGGALFGRDNPPPHTHTHTKVWWLSFHGGPSVEVVGPMLGGGGEKNTV